jgi:probable HAF family extracellular repeat protein
MSDLGALGGTTSYASDVNADGSLVVGSATDAASTRHGFVWSEATGMATVEEWLGTHGIDAGAMVTTSAEKISADGQIVVGQTDHGTTYIARTVKETTGDGGSEPETGNGGSEPETGNGGSEPETGNGDPDTGNGGNTGGGEGGIIDTAAYFPTVATTNGVVLQSGVNNADTIMFGAQGAPMRNLLSVGQKAVWGTVDGGYDDSDVADGGLALGEFGLGYGIADGVTARFSAGGTYTKQDLDAGGDVKQRGFYLSPEFSADLGRNLYVTVGGYWGRSSIDTRRGYLSGAATDYSEGDTNAETWGAKIRFDWLNAFSVEKTAITPYVGLSYARTKADAFTETGGSFPVHFDESSDHATIVRLGADFVHPLTDSVRLLAKTELDYQFESHAAATSGTLIGISAFDLAGRDLDQFWLRGGIGAEFDVGKGVASFMVNATTQGQDPTIWVRSNWTVKF